MKILEGDRVVCFDVDDTLISWEPVEYGDNTITIIDGAGDRTTLKIKQPVVDRVIQHKQRGWITVVWSQSGYEWATKVVQALNLEKYVDVILTKPYRYYDDVPFLKWIGQWKDTNKAKYTGKEDDTKMQEMRENF